MDHIKIIKLSNVFLVKLIFLIQVCHYIDTVHLIPNYVYFLLPVDFFIEIPFFNYFIEDPRMYALSYLIISNSTERILAV
jgi:hypothetical protein